MKPTAPRPGRFICEPKAFDMIDWSKPIVTRNGQKARLLGTVNNSADGPRIVVVEDGLREVSRHYFEDGHYWPHGIDDSMDVINAQEPAVTFLNVYKISMASHDNLEAAKLHTNQHEIKARLRVTYDYNTGNATVDNLPL